MFAFLNCLQNHDPSLLAWAVIVCLVACGATLVTVRRARASTGRQCAAWIGVGSVLLSSGVWSTHFLAMLAYQPALGLRYDLGLTLTSLALALLTMSAGLGLVCIRRDLLSRLAGGAICGVGVALMHFTGVGALQLSAFLVWRLPAVAAAVAVGVLGSAAAVWVAGDLRRPERLGGAALVLVLAICGLHLTGMSAVTLIPNGAPPAGGAPGHAFLIVWVATFAGLMLAGGAGMLVVERVGRLSLQMTIENAFMGAPTALAVFDAEGRTLFWNDSFAEILASLGLQPVRGATLREITPAAFEDGVPAQIAADVARARLGGASRLSDFEAPNGRSYETRASFSTDGRFMIMATDVTERLDLITREAEARRLAEEASRAKSEFLANMSHEIRTPLNGVLGIAGALARTPLAPDQAEMVGLIDNSARTLQALLTDILDLARVEAGGMELRHEPFDLAASVDACAALFDAAAQAKGLDLHVDIAPELRGTYAGDGSRIRQILSNLLGNAVKFTEAGHVALSVYPDAAGGVGFAVADTGIGFGPEQKARLFERFAQADGSITRRYGGSGLGLAISQSLAEVMGGRLEAASAPGRGSRFVLTLPLARIEEAAAGEAEAGDEAPSEAVGGLRVLLAEDHPTNRRVVELILGAVGVELTSVENGVEAVAAFRDQRFDLILMDMQMPVMDGLTAIGEIRALERQQGAVPTPIHVLTANAMPEHVTASLEAGADGHVSKPITAETLLQVVAAAAQAAASGAETACAAMGRVA